MRAGRAAGRAGGRGRAARVAPRRRRRAAAAFSTCVLHCWPRPAVCSITRESLGQHKPVVIAIPIIYLVTSLVGGWGGAGWGGAGGWVGQMREYPGGCRVTRDEAEGAAHAHAHAACVSLSD